jgi:methyl coenzyme M reductase subunit D
LPIATRKWRAVVDIEIYGQRLVGAKQGLSLLDTIVGLAAGERIHIKCAPIMVLQSANARVAARQRARDNRLAC